jgi:O-acetylhomoserine (thiol)-lyase
MERHNENAMKVARYLSEHPAVSWVRYPGLESDPNYPIAQKFFKKGFGGMVVFGIRGGEEAGRRFIEKLKVFVHVVNVGDARSIATHPATTTHAQLTPEQQLAGGITPDLIRLSIGIEHIDDLLADLSQALG